MDYIKEASSKELAARVVAFRLIGINKDLAIKCMQELVLREQNGDIFNYKDYIDAELQKSPKPYLEKEQRNLFKTIFNSELKKL